MTRPIEERAILVTGATDGLGRAVAAELARRGAAVLLHGRSVERGEQALAELRRATGSERLRLYLADLSRYPRYGDWPRRSSATTSA
jgi:NAD(P)-dependent dehydrogenase (short-subunit alcohol dehydrogenase family)